ncbi:MAG: hypothetical protein CSB49_03710 [Proteobacteria bacterium]|nr:MAG: hypothetical protein CSB49_03710 [Pseudomonadota bacterium]
MNDENGTVIGAQTRVAGHLRGDEDLTVHGRVDGNIHSGRGLTVEASGVVVAETVEVGSAIVHGTVVGSITASELVHICEGGRVVGDLQAPRVILAEGALFRGMIDMGPVEEGLEELLGATTMPAPTPAQRPTRPARPQRAGAEKLDEPPTKPLRPAPRKAARPPRRIEKAPTPQARRPAARSNALEKAASAAAQAVARAVKQDPPQAKRARDKGASTKATPKKKSTKQSAPKPPTTAGRKTRAKRKS